MPVYRYEAIDNNGKRISESREAASREDLLLQITSMGWVLLRWRDKDKRGGFLLKFSRKSLKPSLLLRFTSDLAHLIKSDLPVDRALHIVEESSDQKSVKEIAAFLRKEIKQGQSLSGAMELKSNDFSNLYINMVRVGEMAGLLPSVMEKLALLMERTEKTKKFIISSSIYPAILLLTGFASILVIMGFVVPRFAAIFADLGQKIPASTAVLLFVSGIISHWWWALLLCSSVIFFLVLRLIHTDRGKKWIDTNLIKIPGIGDLLLEIQVSRFARTLGILVQSGVPLLKSLSIVRDVVGNSVLRQMSEDIYYQVKEGRSIAAIVKEQKFLPPMIVQMVILGDETGKTGEMLVTAADDLDNKIEAKIGLFLSLVEPAAILIMGLIIGGIVITMLSTIFGINEISF